jgi:hypothetical protein
MLKRLQFLRYRLINRRVATAVARRWFVSPHAERHCRKTAPLGHRRLRLFNRPAGHRGLCWVTCCA